MGVASDEAAEVRIRTVVLGVAREALRESGARGLIMATPPGPESRLLARWCEAGGPTLQEPDPELVSALARVLDDRAPGDGGDAGAGEASTRDAWRAAARIRARDDGLIPAAPVNRTALLLSPRPPSEPFLPLADVPASTVLALLGGCTLPGSFRDVAEDPEALRAVEEILGGRRRGREAGPEAGATDPELRRRVLDALATGSWWRRVPPLVPKLGPGTWPTDLDL